MGRPRTGRRPKAYLDAWEVLPAPLARRCAAACADGRLLTFSRDKATVADKALGADVALLITNRLAEMYPEERSWRVYFAKDPNSATPHAERYAQARKLLEAGYSRQAVAAALGMSYDTMKKRVRGAFLAIRNRYQYTPAEVAEGYRFLIAEGRVDLAADANLCGQVACIRKDHGPKT